LWVCLTVSVLLISPIRRKGPAGQRQKEKVDTRTKPDVNQLTQRQHHNKSSTASRRTVTVKLQLLFPPISIEKENTEATYEQKSVDKYQNIRITTLRMSFIRRWSCAVEWREVRVVYDKLFWSFCSCCGYMNLGVTQWIRSKIVSWCRSHNIINYPPVAWSHLLQLQKSVWWHTCWTDLALRAPIKPSEQVPCDRGITGKERIWLQDAGSLQSISVRLPLRSKGGEPGCDSLLWECVSVRQGNILKAAASALTL